MMQKNVRVWLARTSTGAPYPFSLTSESFGIRSNSMAMRFSPERSRRILTQRPRDSHEAEVHTLAGAELRQFLRASGQCRLFLAKREANLVRSLRGIVIETRSRHHCDADFFHEVARKGKIVGESKIRNIRHDVICARGLVAPEAAVVQDAEHAVALHKVGFREFLIIALRQFERDRTGLLERRRGANRQEIVHFEYGRGSVRRGDGPSYTPSGHAVSLRHAVDGDCAVAHAIKRSHGNVPRALINDVLVDFISDRERIPAHAEVADEFQLFAREYLARRIVRRIYDDRLGAGTEGAQQFIAVKAPVRRAKLHETRRGAGKNRVGTVIFIVRFEDDDLIARIDDPHHGRHHGFGRTAAHGDLAFGIHAHALRAFKFPGDGVAQFFRAPGDGVLIDVVGDGLPRGFLHFVRRGEIWKSLGHIHGVVLQRKPRHLANYGFGKAFRLRGQHAARRYCDLARPSRRGLSRAHRLTFAPSRRVATALTGRFPSGTVWCVWSAFIGSYTWR